MHGNPSYNGMVGGIFVPEEANAIKKIPLS